MEMSIYFIFNLPGLFLLVPVSVPVLASLPLQLALLPEAALGLDDAVAGGAQPGVPHVLLTHQVVCKSKDSY